MAEYAHMINWSALVPRLRYFRANRVAKVCPEIRWHINEQARLTLQSYLVGILWWPTIGLLVLISAGITLAAEYILSALPSFPDFKSRKIAVTEEAWQIVPLDEIRERMGEGVPRILSKKAENDNG